MRSSPTVTSWALVLPASDGLRLQELSLSLSLSARPLQPLLHTRTDGACRWASCAALTGRMLLGAHRLYTRRSPRGRRMATLPGCVASTPDARRSPPRGRGVGRENTSRVQSQLGPMVARRESISAVSKSVHPNWSSLLSALRAKVVGG
jgi:hypothetical protein